MPTIYSKIKLRVTVHGLQLTVTKPKYFEINSQNALIAGLCSSFRLIKQSLLERNPDLITIRVKTS